MPASVPIQTIPVPRSAFVLRFLRLWLLPLLVALLPLQGWAADDTRAAGAAPASQALWLVTGTHGCADPLDVGTLDVGTSMALAEAGEAASSGADLAEQLLPPSAPPLAAARTRGMPPAYAGLALPDPDLPLQPRPPRG